MFQDGCRPTTQVNQLNCVPTAGHTTLHTDTVTRKHIPAHHVAFCKQYCSVFLQRIFKPARTSDAGTGSISHRELWNACFFSPPSSHFPARITPCYIASTGCGPHTMEKQLCPPPGMSVVNKQWKGCSAPRYSARVRYPWAWWDSEEATGETLKQNYAFCIWRYCWNNEEWRLLNFCR